MNREANFYHREYNLPFSSYNSDNINRYRFPKTDASERLAISKVRTINTKRLYLTSLSTRIVIYWCNRNRYFSKTLGKLDFLFISVNSSRLKTLRNDLQLQAWNVLGVPRFFRNAIYLCEPCAFLSKYVSHNWSAKIQDAIIPETNTDNS